MTSAPPGWYADIHGTTRWWDGWTWTEHTWPPVPPTGQPSSASVVETTLPQGGPTAPPPGWVAPVARRRRRWPWLVAIGAGAVVVVAVASLLGVLVRGPGSASDAPRDASVAAFCANWRQDELGVVGDGDLQRRWIDTGTPADMTATERRVWEQYVSAGTVREFERIDRSGLEDLLGYIGTHCWDLGGSSPGEVLEG